MKQLETYRPRGGHVTVVGEDFKIAIQPDGSVTLHFGDETKHVDWIFNEREKRNAAVLKRPDTQQGT